MKNIYEVFDDIAKAKTRAERIDILRSDRRKVLKDVLQGAFHPGIKFVFDKPLEYTPSDSPPGLGYTSIEQEMKRVYLFVEGNPRVDPNLTQQRKEHILMQILEALEAREAEVFMNMMLKDLKVKGLDEKLVREAFPGLI
jgi:hypothetical protein